jgi:cytochrome P450
LEPYGPNVNTAEGKTYQFHVRITAPPFNDISGVNDLVWQETTAQTRALMKSWSQQLSENLQLDVAGVTLAVISLAGFGKRLEWISNSADSEKTVPPGYKLSFLKAMTGTTKNLVAILLLPAWLLNMSPLHEAALAYSQLEKYMRDMIQSEKQNIAEIKDHQSEARGNLLTSLLRVSAAGNSEGTIESRKKAFSENEVIGNLFIFLIAGYETTSNVVLYGLIVLAIRPDIQEKVMAEVDKAYVDASNDGRDQLSYAQDFEKFQYTYGFMV